MTSFRFLVLLALAPLAACVGNGPRPPVATPPPAYEAPMGQPLAEAELEQWWLEFQDPQLVALVTEALANSPDARSAAQRLLEARAVRDSASAATWPRGNLTGSANSRTTNDLGGDSNPLFPTGGTTETETLNFNVSWEVDLFGRVAAARRAANSDLLAARFNAESAKAALAANVADAYFAARGAAIQLADARETARIQQGLRDVVARRVQAGLSAGADLDRVSGDVAQSLAQVTALEAELHAAQRQLLILVGRGFDPTEGLGIDATVVSAPPVPAAIPGDLLTRRPDLREAEARIASAAGRQKVANLALFPTLTLQPGVGLSRSVAPGVNFSGGQITPTTTTSTTGFWAYGVGLTVPVLDIPRLLAEMKAQDARTEQAVIAYEKAVQTAYGEADNALVRLAADHRRVAILTEGEARAARAARAARIRYERGLDDLQQVLSAETAWRATRTQLTGAKVQALRRAVQVYKALGGGWAAAGAPARPVGESAP